MRTPRQPPAEAAGTVTVRLRPERWLTVDYRKQFG